MSGTLFLVGTPIGNMGDITYRAVETLKNVDVIACEDTRHTLQLLNKLEIKKPLISYYKQKEREGSAEICALLEEGKNVALVSDAGMPCISDPGAVVVESARERGYIVTVVPGPSAVVSASSLCGTESGFVFVGFLPEKKKDRDKLLQAFKFSPFPLVFYAAPHDVNRVLTYLYETLGDRKYRAVKEMTKIFETVYTGRLGDNGIAEPKGEFVLLVMPQENAEETDDDFLTERLKEKIDEGMDKKSAVLAVSEECKVSKNRVYKLSLSL